MLTTGLNNKQLILQQVYTWKALRLIAKTRFRYYSEIFAAGTPEDLATIIDRDKKGAPPSSNGVATNEEDLKKESVGGGDVEMVEVDKDEKDEKDEKEDEDEKEVKEDKEEIKEEKEETADKEVDADAEKEEGEEGAVKEDVEPISKRRKSSPSK